MSEGQGGTPAGGFKVETASLGVLLCRRIKVSDRLRASEHYGSNPAPAPSDYARAFLIATATRADGEAVAASEAAALADDELERFAEGILQTEGEAPREDASVNLPPLDAFAALIRKMDQRTAQVYAKEIGRSVVGGLMSGFTAAAVQVAGSPPQRKHSAVVTANPEGIAAAAIAVRPRPAETTLDVFQERLKAFEGQLPEDQEAGVVAVSAPGGPCFFVRETIAISGDMLSLRGFDDDSGPVEVVQHHSQFNVMLVPVKKAGARGPLGFTSGAVAKPEPDA